MGGTIHVVCHECTEEGVYEDLTEAVTVRETHVDETGHRISVLDIATPAA